MFKNLIVLFFILTHGLLQGQNWNQIGNDINGKNTVDYSGRSIAFSDNGNIVAIGAHANDGNGNNSGHVRVYQISNNNWVQLGQEIFGESANDEFGRYVSLSNNGSILAVGAPFSENTNYPNTVDWGKVKVFQYSSGSWNQIGQTIVGAQYGAHSGRVSLSSDGTVLAIGEIGVHPSNWLSSGAGGARVFKFDGSNWNQRGSIIYGESINNESGFSISLSSDGNRVAIGSHKNNGFFGVSSGHVRVWQFSNNEWVQLGQDIDGDGPNNYSGYSVSLSDNGTILAIGAPRFDSNINSNKIYAGQVRVFQLSNNSWVQLGQDIIGEKAGDQSGYSVSLSSNGTVLAVGAPFNNGSSSQYLSSKAGHVRVYKLSNNNWVQVGQDIDGENDDDESGSAVALSSDGSRVAISAPQNDGGGNNSGHVRVFELTTAPKLCPVANNDSYNYVKQTPLNIASAQGVLANDTDSNNDGLTATLVSNSSRGNLTLNSDGSFSYNRCSNTNLQGTFNAVTTSTGNWCPAGTGKVSQKQQFAWSQSGNNLYSVTGGDFTYGGYSACGYNQKPGGTLKIKYECGVLSPIGQSQWGETYTFNSVETSADRSTLTIAWSNSYGESAISVLTDWSGGLWPILSHNDNYQDSFTYKANDGTCNSNVATVSLNVIDNDCPVGVNDVYQVNKGGVLNIISAADGVLINDTDANNNILTAKVASPPLHGNLNLNSNGSFTYAHNGSDNTSDGFKYLANDGYCDSDTVIVTINVSYPTPTNGEWTQEGNDILPPPKIVNLSQPYASEVSISQNGSVVAAGYAAFNKDAVKTTIGLVKVYKNINNVWTQDGYIEGENTSDKFGSSISLSGDGNTLIGGSSSGLTKGFVRVYRKINNTWTKLGSDILGELDNDQFGAQVSISHTGNKIAVSAPNHDGGKGTVRVYNWNGTTWTKMGQDIDGEAANDRSGKWRQLEISGDGNSVAIGSTTNGGGSTINTLSLIMQPFASVTYTS